MGNKRFVWDASEFSMVVNDKPAHVPPGVAVIKDWDPDLHPRGPGGQFGEGSGVERQPNRQIIGDIYEIHDTAGLPNKFHTVVVGIKGNNKGQIYGSTIGTTHDVVLRAIGKGNEIDQFVRFSHDYQGGYEANSLYAGIAFNNMLGDEVNAITEQTAIDNIYQAASYLREAGLSEDTNLAIFTLYTHPEGDLRGAIHTTFTKFLEADLTKEDWAEELHPRDEHGHFIPKGVLDG